jgi:predicted HicB family RNase H-like nuclease
MQSFTGHILADGMHNAYSASCITVKEDPSMKIPVAIRISPELKAAAVARAREENRSFTSYVETLILRDTRASATLVAKAKARREGRRPHP